MKSDFLFQFNFQDRKIGFALTGAYSTFELIIPYIKKLVENGAKVVPIMSFNSYNIDTRYGKSKDFIEKIEEITNNKIINTFVEAEPLGQKKIIDILVIAPCTGNTVSKLANGITDTPVLLAAKSNLRNDNNIVLGICTNDGLSSNAENIGKLLNRKHYYFIPFKQDNPITKPRSLTFDLTYLIPTIEYALNNEQIQPILL